MKKNLWMVVVLVGVGLAGCTPEDRVGQLRTQAESAQGVIEQVNAALPQLEASAGQLRAVLADPAIDAATRDKTLELLVAAEKRIAQLQAAEGKASAYLATIVAAIATLQAGGEITQFDELHLYGQIGAQVGQALPPPYGGYVLLGSSLLTLIGGLLGGKYKQKLDDTEHLQQQDKTTKEIILSVDKMLDEIDKHGPGVSLASAKETLKANQSPDTRAAVQKIKQA